MVRGQFNGYRDEPGVKPDSTVETYVAVRLQIDSWRWQGVPFYIRAGKSLPVTPTEVNVALRQPPAIFSDNAPTRNYLRFRVTPDLAIAIGGTERPGDEMAGITSNFWRPRGPTRSRCLPTRSCWMMPCTDDPTRFAREDYVEEAWRIVQPVLDNATPVRSL